MTYCLFLSRFVSLVDCTRSEHCSFTFAFGLRIARYISSVLILLPSRNKVFIIIIFFQGKLRGVYLTSTITEWLLALSVLTFTLTFAPNFKNMRVDDPRIYLQPKYEVFVRLSTYDKLLSALQYGRDWKLMLAITFCDSVAAGLYKGLIIPILMQNRYFE